MGVRSQYVFNVCQFIVEITVYQSRCRLALARDLNETEMRPQPSRARLRPRLSKIGLFEAEMSRNFSVLGFCQLPKLYSVFINYSLD